MIKGYLIIGLFQTLVLVIWHHKVMEDEIKRARCSVRETIIAFLLWFMLMTVTWPVVIVKAVIYHED